MLFLTCYFSIFKVTCELNFLNLYITIYNLTNTVEFCTDLPGHQSCMISLLSDQFESQETSEVILLFLCQKPKQQDPTTQNHLN